MIISNNKDVTQKYKILKWLIIKAKIEMNTFII